MLGTVWLMIGLRTRLTSSADACAKIPGIAAGVEASWQSHVVLQATANDLLRKPGTAAAAAHQNPAQIRVLPQQLCGIQDRLERLHGSEVAGKHDVEAGIEPQCRRRTSCVSLRRVARVRVVDDRRTARHAFDRLHKRGGLRQQQVVAPVDPARHATTTVSRRGLRTNPVTRRLSGQRSCTHVTTGAPEPTDPQRGDRLQDRRNAMHEHDVDRLSPQVPGSKDRGKDDERHVIQCEPDPGSAASWNEGHAMHRQDRDTDRCERRASSSPRGRHRPDSWAAPSGR